MEQTVACTRCGSPVGALIDQVLDLPAFTICQCRCGEIAVVVKAISAATPQDGDAFGSVECRRKGVGSY
jgi:hypothetical protein